MAFQQMRMAGYFIFMKYVVLTR